MKGETAELKIKVTTDEVLSKDNPQGIGMVEFSLDGRAMSLAIAISTLLKEEEEFRELIDVAFWIAKHGNVTETIKKFSKDESKH